jgi:hypothetical protein
MIRNVVIGIAMVLTALTAILWAGSYFTDLTRHWEFTETSSTTLSFRSGHAHCFASHLNESMEPQETMTLGRHPWAELSWYSFSIYSYDEQGFVHSGISFPLWIAFLFFASITTILAYGPLRRRRRRKRNQCIHCGYNLIGLPEPRCPECGHEP